MRRGPIYPYDESLREQPVTESKKAQKENTKVKPGKSRPDALANRITLLHANEGNLTGRKPEIFRRRALLRANKSLSALQEYSKRRAPK